MVRYEIKIDVCEMMSGMNLKWTGMKLWIKNKSFIFLR